MLDAPSTRHRASVKTSLACSGFSACASQSARLPCPSAMPIPAHCV